MATVKNYEPPKIACQVVKHANVDRISDKKYRSSLVQDTHNITERRTAEFVEQQRSQHTLHFTEMIFKQMILTFLFILLDH